MIAIPFAAFMRPVAVIVGLAPQTRCNDAGRSCPMIAIRAADDCGSLQVRIPVTPPSWPEPTKRSDLTVKGTKPEQVGLFLQAAWGLWGSTIHFGLRLA
jgi:hypothetical protein